MARISPFVLICIIPLLRVICGKDACAKDFIELVNKPYFVDHTELMRYFYEDFFYTIVFLSCPRGFGKTTNLQMIQLFNDLELNADHSPKHQNDTKAFEVFTKLAVGNPKFYRWLRDNLARHPVIFIDLEVTHTLDDFTEEKIYQFLSEKFYEGFERYKWILDVPAETLNKLNLLHPYRVLEPHLEMIKKLSEKKLTNEFEAGEGLYRFAHFLHVYFQTGVVLLIDNYDNAFIKSHQPSKASIQRFYGIVNNVIKHVVSPPQNEVTINVWVTATTGLLYPSINNYIEKSYTMTCLEGQWVLDYYGFNEIDIADIAKRYKLKPEQVNDMRKHYGGYTLKNFTTFYNPSSVVKYLENLSKGDSTALRPYMEPNIEDDFLKGFRNNQVFRDIAKDIVASKTTEFGLTQSYNISDFQRFVHLNDKYKYDKTDYNTLIRYVYDQGYVTYDTVGNETAMFSTFGYKSPNVEANLAFKKLILE